MKNKCESCGGQLSFDPKSKSVKCFNCGLEKPIEYEPKSEKKAFVEDNEAYDADFAKALKQIKCKSCGANVLLNNYAMQSNCPYCGTSEIYEQNGEKKLRVDSIIPFAFDKAEALERFKQTVKGRFFANKQVLNHLTLEDIKATYINAYVFDFHTHSRYTCVERYYKDVKRPNGLTSTETYYKTRRGTHDEFCNNISIEVNSNLNQKEFESVLPFDYNSAVAFNQDFLTGYMVEYQDEDFDSSVVKAKEYAKSSAYQSIRSKFGTNVDSLDVHTSFIDEKYNYSLLPVYFVSRTVKDKPKTVLMNGQTGKTGSVPLNKWKVFWAIIIGLGLLGGLIALLFSF